VLGDHQIFRAQLALAAEQSESGISALPVVDHAPRLCAERTAQIRRFGLQESERIPESQSADRRSRAFWSAA
jgi:hypothetical protein